jgi:DNA-binding MarR family transcriptional regulator
MTARSSQSRTAAPSVPGRRDAPSGAAADRRQTIEELRHALGHMSGAERRLRSRDHNQPGELTHAHLRSIAALGRQPEMTVGEIARGADLKPATVTVMIDQLEAAHIVQRRRSTEDRRVCHVSLTPEGWKLLEEKLDGWQKLWEAEFDGVTDDDLQTAIRVIERVTGIYDTVAKPAESPESPDGR